MAIFFVYFGFYLEMPDTKLRPRSTRNHLTDTKIITVISVYPT